MSLLPAGRTDVSVPTPPSSSASAASSTPASWPRRLMMLASLAAGVAVAATALASRPHAGAAAPSPVAPHAMAAATGKAVSAPNVVLLVMDDLDMSVWQNALDRNLLPRIQADVIAHGTTFDNTFVAESLCCPSRTTMLTGQYPHNHGVVDNFGDHGGFAHFDRDASTIATWMHAAGYRTGLVGKYLNGYGHTTKDANGSYIPPGWEFWRALTSHRQFDYDMSVQGVMTHYGTADADYQEDVLSGMAQQFLAVNDPRPFFLVLTPTAPHYEGSEKSDDDGVWVRPAPRYASAPVLATIPPESLSSFNEADMTDKPKFMQALPLVTVQDQRDGYNSKVNAIRAVDDMLGAVVDQLTASGRLASTLIIVTSDNGFQYGTHRRKGKTDMYEESVRVPMVIRGPGQVTPRRAAEWAMNLDWAPTIAEAGHATPDITMDGISLVPWYRGGTGTVRKGMLVEQPSDYQFSIHPPQRMLRSRDPAITGDATGQATLLYVQTLTRAGGVSDVEFYDLSTDPLQLQSLHASKDPQRVSQRKSMKAQVNAVKACVGSACVLQ